MVRTSGSDQTWYCQAGSLGGARRLPGGGGGGGGGRRPQLIYLFMWCSPPLISYRASSSTVLWLLFPSEGSFVQREEAFNTQTPGVNNRFDLADKLRVRLRVWECLCVSVRTALPSYWRWWTCVISCLTDNANCLWLQQQCDKPPKRSTFIVPLNSSWYTLTLSLRVALNRWAEICFLLAVTVTVAVTVVMFLSPGSL